MGFFTGLVGGVLDTVAAKRQENQQRQAQRQALEGNLFKTLLGSHDPKVQALGLQGLLASVNPTKAKGLRGWLDESEANPAVEQFTRLMQTPVEEERQTPTFTLPSTETRGMAALPSTSMVEPSGQQPGGGPPTPPAVTLGRPVPRAPELSGFRTERVSRPRTVFPDARQEAILAAQGKAEGTRRGEIEGLYPYVPREVAAQAILQRDLRLARGAAAPFQAITGEVTDPDGTVRTVSASFDRTQGVYLDADPSSPTYGQPLAGFRQRSAAPPRFGMDREAIAGEPEFGGKPFNALTPEQKAAVNQEVIRRAGETSGARTAASGQARIGTALGMPIGISAGTAQRVDPTTPLGRFAGITPLTSDQFGRLDAAKLLEPQIAQMAALVRQVFPQAAGITGARTAAMVLAAKRAAADPSYAQLEGLINLAVGNVARVLAAESGRLTQQDVERAQTALVQLRGGLFSGDTMESALARLAMVEAALDAIEADIQTPAEQIQQGGPPGQTAAPVAPATPGSPRAEFRNGEWVIVTPSVP